MLGDTLYLHRGHVRYVYPATTCMILLPVATDHFIQSACQEILIHSEKVEVKHCSFTHKIICHP